jgi:hypothetical protein
MWNDKEFFELQSGNNYSAAKVGEIIFVSAADAFDHPVDTQIFKTARYLTNGKIGQVMSEVFVAQSVDVIFSAYDYFTKGLVVWRKKVDAFVGSSLDFFGRRYLVEDILTRRGVINFRNEGEVTFVGSHHKGA